MQTILGSGGSIGTDLAKALQQYTDKIKSVSRNPVKVNDTDILQSADLTDSKSLEKAVESSSICYVTIGFEYNLKVWQQQWLSFIKNAVDACIKYNSKLVFFDNVYAIGKDNIKHITENSAISPSSKKGEIRAEVDRFIIERIEKGNPEIIIARSPDFFGPEKKNNSLIMNLIYDNLIKGKTAQWFGNADVIHSMGFTPDLAKGTAMLGNSPDAYNQIWNLPVDKNALTGREWVKLFADELKTSDKVKVIPEIVIKLLGIFVPVLREMPEMIYQFENQFYFDSSKFISRFNFEPTKNKEAVRLTIQKLRK